MYSTRVIQVMVWQVCTVKKKKRKEKKNRNSKIKVQKKKKHEDQKTFFRRTRNSLVDTQVHRRVFSQLCPRVHTCFYNTIETKIILCIYSILYTLHECSIVFSKQRAHYICSVFLCIFRNQGFGHLLESLDGVANSEKKNKLTTKEQQCPL